MINEEDMNFPPDINRAGIVVKLKKPFIDWIIFVGKERDEDDVLGKDGIEMEGFDSKHIYLMPAYDENKDYDKFIKKNYHKILENELYGWYIEPELWPQDRSWKVFNEWIDWEIETMVFDLADDEPIGYEE